MRGIHWSPTLINSSDRLLGRPLYWLRTPRTMTMPWQGNSSHITGSLWGESTGHQWIPLTRGNVKILWWCHDMEMVLTLLTLCEGNPLVTSRFPHKGPIMQSFNVVLNKLINKQLSCLRSETPYPSCDISVMTVSLICSLTGLTIRSTLDCYLRKGTNRKQKHYLKLSTFISISFLSKIKLILQMIISYAMF